MPRYPHSVPPLVEPDPWALEDNGYSVNAFYTSAGQDSVAPRVRISNKQMAEIGNLIAERTIPEYRQAADVIRDAVYHRLYFIAHNYDQPELARTIRTEQEMERAREEIARTSMFDDAIKLYKDEFQHMQRQRNQGGMEKALERVRRCLDSADAEDSTYRAELTRLEVEMKAEIAKWR